MYKPNNNSTPSIILTSILFISSILFSSCAIEDLFEDIVDPVEIDASLLGNWKNEIGEVTFVITSSVISYNGSSYTYSEDIDVMFANNIYSVEGTSSSSSSSISFYLTYGSDSNEIEISTSSANSGFITYYKDVSQLGTDLPTQYIGEWLNENADLIYKIGASSIEYNSAIYQYSKLTDVALNNNIYSVSATTSTSDAMEFHIKGNSDSNEIEISTSSSNSGFVTYYKTVVVQIETELPSQFYGDWFNESGTWIYWISSNSGSTNHFFQTNNIQYFFSQTDVEEVETGVFKINGISSSNTTKEIFIKDGVDSNSIKISESSNTESGYVNYWNSVANIPTTFVEIPGYAYNEWHAVGSSSYTYVIYVYTEDTHTIYWNGGYYDFSINDVTEPSSGVFQIPTILYQTTTELTFYLKLGSDENKMEISTTSSISGFTSYYGVTGYTINSTLCTNGNVFGRYGTTLTWYEYTPNGTYTFTETGRDDWSVYLTKSDGAKIRVDMYYKEIYYAGAGSNSYGYLYTMEEYSNDSGNNW